MTRGEALRRPVQVSGVRAGGWARLSVYSSELAGVPRRSVGRAWVPLRDEPGGDCFAQARRGAVRVWGPERGHTATRRHLGSRYNDWLW